MVETIANLEPRTLGALSQLAVALRDSQVGLTDAAATVSRKDVVQLLYRLAGERADMEQELSHLLAVNSQPLPDDTSWLGELRTIWMRIRTAIAQNQEAAALAEVAQSEAIIVDRYRRLMAETSGNAVNDVLLRQFAKLRDGHRELVRLTQRASDNS